MGYLTGLSLKPTHLKEKKQTGYFPLYYLMRQNSHNLY